MATNEETNAAGTDTRPPMLVEDDYDSWKIRIQRLIPDQEETLTLDNESRSKLNKDLVKPFDYTKLR
ncbi:hypothetical protein Tco_0036774 [Tanacetum coccineum]